MNIIKQQNEIANCIELVFSSTTELSILQSVENTINILRKDNFFSELPKAYENLSIETIEDILSWHQEMKEDNRVQAFEEGRLKELYDLFSAVNLKTKGI